MSRLTTFHRGADQTQQHGLRVRTFRTCTHVFQYFFHARFVGQSLQELLTKNKYYNRWGYCSVQTTHVDAFGCRSLKVSVGLRPKVLPRWLDPDSQIHRGLGERFSFRCGFIKRFSLADDSVFIEWVAVLLRTGRVIPSAIVVVPSCVVTCGRICGRAVKHPLDELLHDSGCIVVGFACLTDQMELLFSADLRNHLLKFPFLAGKRLL